jgi:hypothetical protein
MGKRDMKVWVLALASIALGIGGGVGVATFEYGPTLPAGPTPLSTHTNDSLPPTETKEAGVVQIDQTLFDFGTMEHSSTMRHDFTFTNVGDGPLKLTQGEKTCKCTAVEMSRAHLRPGDSSIVTLEWKAENEPGPLRVVATILTDDPTRPAIDLTIEGQVTQAVWLTPGSLVVGAFPSTESAEAQAHVYAFHRDSFQILAAHSHPKETAEFFETSWTPADAERLSGEKAKSGYAVNVKVKPGMPLGPFKQSIELETDIQAAPRLTLTVEGSVTSDISLSGRDYNTMLAVLRLGRLSSREGGQRTLKLLTRGKYRDGIEFKVAKVDPDVLQVTLGKPETINKGTVVAVPLQVSVPKGSKQVNRLGSDLGEYGEVVLETNHPDTKEIRFEVQFSVE